jgi:hypothetical protein
MMEIVRYAICNEDGEVYGSYEVENNAVCSPSFKKGCTIVKMVGQLPEQKKPKLMAPCLCKSSLGRIMLSERLFESEAEAKDIIVGFISWPAVANAEGFYSVEDA